ncbi:MAG: hypothetical protein ACYS15_10585 [Planctomycetota bacterium]|jgi:hypothetical protein
MLTRYKMYRGPRPQNDPLPEGERRDTRKHTKHCLRPTPDIVERYLADTSVENWKLFEGEYLEILEARFAADPKPFEDLAAQASATDVYLGCSCPTTRNSDPSHCHTILALRFMKDKFPDLEVVFP